MTYVPKFLGVILATLIITTAPPVWARPISYAGGWTFMQMNNSDANMAHILYSPTSHYSFGYDVEYWRDTKTQVHAAQFNYLLKRWNNHDSQGNLYWKSGAGVAYSDHEAWEGKTEPVGMAGLAIDWEDRRWFTSYENQTTYAGDIEKSFWQKARVGVAPYVGEYGDLHTWLMVEVRHWPGHEDEFLVTPLVRLFKGTFLTEVGASHKGDLLFNLTYQF